jgi:RNA polymerase sigma-54 factor
MQQSLKILHMTTQELNDYLKDEINQNPFLELNENAPQEIAAIKEDEGAAAYQNHWQQDNYSRFDKSASYLNNEFEDFIAEKPQLRDYLQTQLSHLKFAQKQRIIAIFLIDALDDNGYLKIDLNEVASILSCSIDDIEEVIEELQKFEPAGLFARNLRECLYLQLSEAERKNQAFNKLLKNLELVAKGEAKKLCKLLKVDTVLLQKMVRRLKELDPKPARNFSTDAIKFVTPDAFILKDMDNKFRVILNSDYIPKLNVNGQYFSNVLEHAKSKNEKHFCISKMQNANWLKKVIEQRSQTLLKVLNEIVDQQWEFFEKGINFLKPMTLNQISSKLDLHESTVSRISNKYVATSFGVFDIKSFYSNSLPTNYSSDKISTSSIKSKIKALIDRETKTLSDDDLADILKQLGIEISRRTVAKYRESLGVESSHQRKRRKVLDS